MADLPSPLTPTDCDLRTMPSLPLDVVRLLDSDLFLFGTGDEFKAAVALWLKSWQQVPAASLPDDERVLSVLSGAGPKWKKVRARALRGWTKCSDGRLYHPVVAEKAKIAWEQRKAQRSRANRRWEIARGGNVPPKGPGGEPNPSAPASKEASARASAHANGHAAAVPTHMQGNGNGNGKESESMDSGSEPRAREPTPFMPARSDPPERWMHLADKPEVDGAGVRRPVVEGYYLDKLANEVCEAAGYGANWRGDWRPLIGWLREGFDPYEVILPAIRRVASWSGYKLPRTLHYFDKAVRETAEAA